MRRQVLGPRHADVAITLVELSRALVDQGRNAEAEPPAREALDIRKAVFGENHRETATSKSDLGQILQRRGDLAGAEILLRENLATALQVLGAGPPQHRRRRWATWPTCCMAQGDPVSAEALARQAVAVQRRVLRRAARRVRRYAEHPGADGRSCRDGSPKPSACSPSACGSAAPQLSADHPKTAGYVVNLARVRHRARRRGGHRGLARARRSASARRTCGPTTGASDRRRACSRQRWSRAAASPRPRRLMLAADRLLKPLAGGQARERDANRARLVELYRASGRPVPAELAR